MPSKWLAGIYNSNLKCSDALRIAVTGFAGRSSFTHGSDDSRNVGPRRGLQEHDPEKLWRQYVQLTEVEAVFRTLKSELNLRPIFHWIQSRVEAHILIAFLAYCLWVCLKTKASFPRW
jgi:transposase